MALASSARCCTAAYSSLTSTMDQSPTALFDSYESDFQQISASIKSKLEDEAKNQTGGESGVLGTPVIHNLHQNSARLR